jgi:hypothetical protein
MAKAKQKHRFFSYGYISEDKVLQNILQPLLCQGLFLEAENYRYCDTEQEIIRSSEFSMGSNKYFDDLPLKCKLFLIINFIKGISDPESLPENLDHNFYLTVNHLFDNLYQEITSEMDEEDETDETDEAYKYIKREYVNKCLHIINSDDPPEKSIEVLNTQYYDHEEDTIDEDGKKYDSDILLECWEENVSYLQGRLFGGFGTGEFIWSKERISGCIKEHKLLSQLCVNYSLFELVQQYIEIVDKYGNIDLLEIKG